MRPFASLHLLKPSRRSIRRPFPHTCYHKAKKAAKITDKTLAVSPISDTSAQNTAIGRTACPYKLASQFFKTAPPSALGYVLRESPTSPNIDTTGVTWAIPLIQKKGATPRTRAICLIFVLRNA